MRSNWLKQHGSGERSFSRALEKFFDTQAKRIADALTENFPGGIDNDSVSAIFDIDTEHRALQPVIQRNVTRLALSGALAELEAVGEGSRGVKGIDDAYWQSEVAGFIETIPQAIRDRIRVAVDEAFSQPFWLEITSQIGSDLRGVIQQSIDAGDAGSTMAKRIREQLGGSMARKRALRIARTETTGALNAGHVEAMAELEAAGLLKGKQWLAISDKDTRQEHENLSGSVVRVADGFDIGGHLAPYPGHYSLPASERVHCRCTVLSVFD